MIAYRPSMYNDFPAAPYTYLNDYDDDDDDFDHLHLQAPPPPYNDDEPAQNSSTSSNHHAVDEKRRDQHYARTAINTDKESMCRCRRRNSIFHMIHHFRQSLAHRRATRREKRPQDGKTNPFE